MNQRGTTLLEVMIGGTLVAIAAVATALMFSMGQSFIASEGDNRVAIQIAQGKMERIRAGGYGLEQCCVSLLPCDGREEPLGAPGACTVAGAWATDAATPGYRWRVTVLQACPHDFTQLATSASACWPGFGGPGLGYAKRFTVTVQPLEGMSATDQDRMARQVVLNGIMVSH